MFIVKRMDIELASDVDAVPLVSERRGFNCVKLIGIVREVLNNSAAEKIAIDNFKKAIINDNHLFRLRVSKCTSEISLYFTGATSNSGTAANL